MTEFTAAHRETLETLAAKGYDPECDNAIDAALAEIDRLRLERDDLKDEIELRRLQVAGLYDEIDRRRQELDALKEQEES